MRAGSIANIIIVEFGLLNQLEPMPRVEAIGVAPSKGADADGVCEPLGLCEDRRQCRCTQTLALKAWLDVEMSQEQRAGLRLEDEEAHFGACEEDVAGMSGREAGKESLPGSQWIKSADALQAFPHRLNAKRSKGLGIRCHGVLKGNLALHWQRPRS